MFTRILVEIDLEAQNEVLLEKVIALANGTDSQVLLSCSLHCHSIEYGYVFDEQAKETAKQAYAKAREAKLNVWAQSLVDAGVNVNVDIAWSSDKYAAVLKLSEVFNADLVVIDLPEQSAIERLFKDSALALARNIKCPLLMLTTKLWSEPLRVGVGFDPFHEHDTPAALDDKMLNLTNELAEKFSTVASVIHCIHTLPHAAIFDEHVVTDYTSLKEKVTQDHKNKVGSMVANSALSTRGDLVYLSGECHLELPTYVKNQSLDLLVMGHALHGFIDRILQGDMLDKIISEITCDILVVNNS